MKFDFRNYAWFGALMKITLLLVLGFTSQMPLFSQFIILPLLLLEAIAMAGIIAEFMLVRKSCTKVLPRVLGRSERSAVGAKSSPSVVGQSNTGSHRAA